MKGEFKRIESMMEKNGFKLLRKTKHVTWTNGKNKIFTALTPSDHRAFQNIRTVVRRYTGAAFVP